MFIKSIKKPKAILSKYKKMFKICLVLLLLTNCGILGKGFLVNRSTASVKLSFSYDESSEGLYPNKTRFNMSDIKNTEVLSEVVNNDYCSKNGIEEDDLKSYLSVKPVGAKSYDSSNDEYFVATTYEITVKVPALSGIDASILLDDVCSSYRSYFMEYHTVNHNFLSLEKDDLVGDEYYSTITLFSKKADQISEFIDTRLNTMGNYVAPEGVTSYKTLKQSITDFKDYNLENYRAYILQNGIAKNKEHLITTLQYENLTESINYKIHMSKYLANLQGVNMYNSDIIASVLIPTRDEHENYYMSRTDSGIDYMAESSKSNLEFANEELKTVRSNSKFIETLENTTTTEEQLQKLDGMESALYDSLNNIYEDLLKTESSFLEYKSGDYMSIKPVKTKVFSKNNLKTIVLADIGLIVCFVFVLKFSEKNSWKVKGEGHE